MKEPWRQKVHLDSRAPFDFDLQASQIQQAGSRRRVHEQVQVAAFLIFAVQNRPEDARVRHAGFKHKLADGVSMLG
jgi:hypothetical protein